MVHVQSTSSKFNDPSSEIASYWFGYMLARGYMFKNRNRLRCRAPLQDIGHLFLLAKDLGIIKVPKKITSNAFGSIISYSQLIIDSKWLCDTLRDYGWDSTPSKTLDYRHVLRGILDGGGSITRNGKGRQSKYLKITFYIKDEILIGWIINQLKINIGPHYSVNDGYVSLVGKSAQTIASMSYLDQSIYLKRKLDATGLFSR